MSNLSKEWLHGSSTCTFKNVRGDDDDFDSFDVGPNIPDDQEPSCHPLRLHRLSINRREDASILCAGRAFLPARNQTSIRQRIHRPVAQLPEPNRRAP